MVTVHRDLVLRLGANPPRAVLLETPYGFQENASDISRRAQRYFSRSVGLEVSVPAGLRAPEIGTRETDAALAAVRGADWLFSGPGSPSYALAHWRRSPFVEILRERVTRPGVTVFASAAACTAGVATVPVYEIYKVGAAPHWLDGLDLLSPLGLRVAVIPHYDNAEGGTHDTRYSYLGERRLRILERELPNEAAVLGVDEHTAVVIDLDAATVEVRGRGGLTVRRRGVSTVTPAGATLTLEELRAQVSGHVAPARDVPGRSPGEGWRADRKGAAHADLREIVADCERRFDTAVAARDAGGLAPPILDLEAAIAAWSADTEEDVGTEAARIALHGLIVRLGEVAAAGLRDAREALLPAVDPLVTVRDRLRRARAFEFADQIRAALRRAGVELRDTMDGTVWALEASAPPSASNAAAASGRGAPDDHASPS